MHWYAVFHIKIKYFLVSFLSSVSNLLLKLEWFHNPFHRKCNFPFDFHCSLHLSIIPPMNVCPRPVFALSSPPFPVFHNDLLLLVFLNYMNILCVHFLFKPKNRSAECEKRTSQVSSHQSSSSLNSHNTDNSHHTILTICHKSMSFFFSKDFPVQ